jgi:hypothetical protein
VKKTVLLNLIIEGFLTKKVPTPPPLPPLPSPPLPFLPRVPNNSLLFILDLKIVPFHHVQQVLFYFSIF